MDLSALNLTDRGSTPKRLDIKSPITSPREPLLDDAGQPMFVYVTSIESREFQKYRYELRAKSAKGELSGDADDLQFRDAEWSARLLMAKPWSIQWKGVKLEHTLENARMLMTELPWLRSDVDVLSQQPAEFLGNGSSSSPSTASTSSSSASDPKAAA